MIVYSFIIELIYMSNAPINVNPVRGECGQGAGIWCLRLSPCRAFDRAKRSRDRDIWLWPTEAWYQFRSGSKSVPRGFLKVTLLEKGMKLIMSILRKVLSSSSHLIVKLDWNRIPPWKSEDFLRVTDPTCSDMLSRCYKAFYVSLIL